MQDQDDRDSDLQRMVEEPVDRVLEPPEESDVLMDASLANEGGEGAPLEGVGVYDRPGRTNWSVALIILLIIAAAIVAYFLLR